MNKVTHFINIKSKQPYTKYYTEEDFKKDLHSIYTLVSTDATLSEYIDDIKSIYHNKRILLLNTDVAEDLTTMVYSGNDVDESTIRYMLLMITKQDILLLYQDNVKQFNEDYNNLPSNINSLDMEDDEYRIQLINVSKLLLSILVFHSRDINVDTIQIRKFGRIYLYLCSRGLYQHNRSLLYYLDANMDDAMYLECFKSLSVDIISSKSTLLDFIITNSVETIVSRYEDLHPLLSHFQQLKIYYSSSLPLNEKITTIIDSLNPRYKWIMDLTSPDTIYHLMTYVGLRDRVKDDLMKSKVQCVYYIEKNKLLDKLESFVSLEDTRMEVLSGIIMMLSNNKYQFDEEVVKKYVNNQWFTNPLSKFTFRVTKMDRDVVVITDIKYLYMYNYITAYVFDILKLPIPKLV